MQMQSMKLARSYFQYLVWIHVSDQPVTSLASTGLGLQTEKRARCWTTCFPPLGNLAALILVGSPLCSVSERQGEPVTEFSPESIQQDLHLFSCKVYSEQNTFHMVWMEEISFHLLLILRHCNHHPIEPHLLTPPPTSRTLSKMAMSPYHNSL